MGHFPSCTGVVQHILKRNAFPVQGSGGSLARCTAAHRCKSVPLYHNMSDHIRTVTLRETTHQHDVQQHAAGPDVGGLGVVRLALGGQDDLRR